MAEKEIKVPDIGDFDVVPIIEIFIKPGDIVQKEQALLVLESDKASMEIPSDEAGKIVSVAVKVGDKVGKGQKTMTGVVLTIVPIRIVYSLPFLMHCL